MNCFCYKSDIDVNYRQKIKGHKNLVVWFYGLSASGKSTLAYNVEKRLIENNIHTYTLDGDRIRHGLCVDLDFSYQHRKENLRRVAEVCKLFFDAGLVVLAAFITPYNNFREMIKNIVGEENIFFVYCKCPVEVCMERDKKGLYKKALSGEIRYFTGVNDPFEEPEYADLIIETNKITIHESVEIVLESILKKLV